MRYFAALLVCCVVGLTGAVHAEESDERMPPKVGDTAPDVQLQPVKGAKFKVSNTAEQGPVVIVVLRGYPGYQCPLCSRQVADLRKHAKEFKELGATVLLVYPGSADELQKRAEEFLEGETLPEPLRLVIDPNYEFTERYGLRWDAPAETAYPSAFVLDENRTVKYGKVSKTHGGRADTEELLEAVRKL